MSRAVCIVDDDASVRKSLGNLLRSAGFECLAFAAGEVFLASGQSREAGCVLLDLKMPGMSGMEVLRAIKILQPDVPVIMITGYATVDSAVEAMQSGAFTYIAKPFTPEQIVERRKQQRERQRDTNVRKN